MPLQASGVQPSLRAFDLSGTLRVPENLISQGPLAGIPAMSIRRPFETVAGLTVVDARTYRLLALGPTSAESEMSWTADGRVQNALVEVIDPETGEVVARGRTDANGQFRTRAAARDSSKTAFIVQAVLKNAAGQAAGILVAPLGASVVSVETKRKSLDVTAGTTLLAFTSMLMSENVNDITLDKGFTGIQSVRLSKLLQEIDSTEINKAAKVLDLGTPILSSPNFDVLLGNLATSSAVLTYEIKKLSEQAAGGAIDSNEAEVSFHATIMSQTISNIAKVFEQSPASASANLFQEAASRVDLDEAKKKADAIQQAIPPKSVPPLPPAPTPTPGDIGVVFQ